MNASMYPLVFENGGSVKFDAPASAVGVEVRFRFEYLPHPNVDPAYDTAVHTITEGANEIAIPSQGSNTFSSFIFYVVTPDVELTINSINVETLMQWLVISMILQILRRLEEQLHSSIISI